MAFRNRIVTMIGLAIGVGGAAAFGADRYLSNQVADVVTVAPAPQVAFKTIVTASTPLRYGTELTRSSLAEIPWPEDALPEGAFATIDDLMAGGRRVALTAIEPNEPVLKGKITGPDGRAGLASLISEGMRATTVRVDDVAGVAGFILPGDRVDVVWTRRAGDAESVATVIQQNVRVLTIDQIADDRAEEPRVVEAVTLEVDAEGAQRLTVASATGSLSLVLRGAGDTVGLDVSAVSIRDLDTTRVTPADGYESLADAGQTATVWVTHAETRVQHTVPNTRNASRVLAAARGATALAR